jgi:signal transduction histidine kinase
MKAGSIRLRLLIAAAVSVVAALALAGVGLTYLFERHVERRIEAELANHMNEIIAGLEIAGDGSVNVIQPPTDPRFSAPLSGLYWQVVDEATGSVIRSRSLWDTQLAMPAKPPADGAVQLVETKGPTGGLLVGVDREVREAAHNDRPFRVLVALDHREVDEALQEFGADIVPSLAILAAFLIIAAGLQVAIGLRPLEKIRQGVGEIVAGRSSRMTTEVPSELRPLVGEINRLLESQAEVLGKARTRASDLAHGLKTPLQVLAADVRALRAKGEATMAHDIDQVATTIRRHVERELARSRAAPSTGTRLAACRVAEVARRVVDVVKRTPRGEHLDFIIKAVPDVTAWIDEVDLAEILGNLVENASRFAKAKVVIEASSTGTMTTIAVEDDGQGIPVEARKSAMARGERLDIGGDGTGLGLAIVSDVVEAYAGTLKLEDARPGLKAVVTLPSRSLTLIP